MSNKPSSEEVRFLPDSRDQVAMTTSRLPIMSKLSNAFRERIAQLKRA